MLSSTHILGTTGGSGGRSSLKRLALVLFLASFKTALGGGSDGGLGGPGLRETVPVEHDASGGDRSTSA